MSFFFLIASKALRIGAVSDVTFPQISFGFDNSSVMQTYVIIISPQTLTYAALSQAAQTAAMRLEY